MNYAPFAPFLMVISGFLHAVVNAILKSGKDKMAGRALIDGFSSVLVLPLTFFVPLPTGAWPWILSSLIVHLIYLVSLIKAFESLDMSVAYPIARGIAPILAAAGAVLVFHEPITRVIVIGIALPRVCAPRRAPSAISCGYSWRSGPAWCCCAPCGAARASWQRLRCNGSPAWWRDRCRS